MQKVFFNYADRKVKIQDAETVKKLIAKIFQREKKPLQQVNYIFCSDEYLLEINRSFLSHDYYTDIITFPLQDKNKPIISEIYISIDRVKENSKLFGCTIKMEMMRIIIHGALHLCDYGDKTKKEKIKMTEKEDLYLSMFNNL